MSTLSRERKQKFVELLMQHDAHPRFISVNELAELLVQASLSKKEKEREQKPPRETTPTPPEVKLFREVTERYPNKVNFEDVSKIIQGVSKRLRRDCTAEDLRPFYAAWCANGWNKLNLAWLAYAERGEMPTVQKFKPAQNKQQASADALENYVKKLEMEAAQ